MKLLARTFFSQQPESREVGKAAGRELLLAFGDAPLRAALVYSSVNHDQAEVLRGLRDALGEQVPIVGCSSQGVMSDGTLSEEGFACGVMAIGGSELRAAVAREHAPESAPRDKGRALGEALKRGLGSEPTLTVLLYDPTCGVDVQELLSGMRSEIASPIVGGGASHRWGPPVRTYQYFGDEATRGSAVALGLCGPFAVELGVTHGTSPTGVTMLVTKALGNKVLEIDGRRAIDVWSEATGFAPGDLLQQDYLASWAIGVERQVTNPGPGGPAQHTEYLIHAAAALDYDLGATVLQAAIPPGTTVMFHHRTVNAVREGARKMGRDLATRLGQRNAWAVLGFECGARTSPFLGLAETVAENAELRARVAPHAPWLGMLAWGEIAPSGGEPAFHNYTYPLAVLVE